MTEHSRLPPSSAARRVACPGSRALEETYKSTEQSPAAREGETAHYIAAWYLQNPDCDDFAPTVAPNGELITEEMIDGALLYQQAIMSMGIAPESLHIEERVDISTIHPDCFGTPDCWFMAWDDLHIFDYKFGHGYVEAFENWQLIEYTAGILANLPRNEYSCNENLNVTFHIVQPRCYTTLGNVRSWKTTASNLASYFTILRQAECLADQPNTKTHVSPQCNYCAARHACPTLQRSALTAVDMAYMNAPVNLSPSYLGSELRHLTRAAELLDARIAGLSEQAIAHIKRGDRVPHFMLQETPGRLAWGVPPAEVIKLGELLEVNLAKPPEAITPRQAIAAGISEALIEVYCERQRGALKLATVDERETRKIFGGNK